MSKNVLIHDIVNDKRLARLSGPAYEHRLKALVKANVIAIATTLDQQRAQQARPATQPTPQHFDALAASIYARRQAEAAPDAAPAPQGDTPPQTPPHRWAAIAQRVYGH
jgi:hypothetical protein